MQRHTKVTALHNIDTVQKELHHIFDICSSFVKIIIMIMYSCIMKFVNYSTALHFVLQQSLAQSILKEHQLPCNDKLE